MPEEPGTETLRVPVLRVFDGDGFLTRLPVAQSSSYYEVAVRFGFIDAPEIDQRGGLQARDFLHHLIADKWIDLVLLMKMDTGRIIDRHRRIVAVPYLKQCRGPEERPASSILRRVMKALFDSSEIWRNVELEMVLNGWAWVLDRYQPDARYFEALEDAQRQRRGIWAWDDNIHPWEFKKQKHARRREHEHVAQKRQQLLRRSEAPLRCPEKGCEGNLVQRSGRYGAFYGCSKYPRCRYSCRAES